MHSHVTSKIYLRYTESVSIMNRHKFHETMAAASRGWQCDCNPLGIDRLHMHGHFGWTLTKESYYGQKTNLAI